MSDELSKRAKKAREGLQKCHHERHVWPWFNEHANTKDGTDIVSIALQRLEAPQDTEES